MNKAMDKHYNYCCRYSLNNKSISGRICGSNRKWVLRDIRKIITSETLDGCSSTFEVVDKDGHIVDRCCYIEPNGFRYSIKGYKQYVP